jgi:hypothetical protein
VTLDTELIWRALGDFYDMFPVEERVYWDTFWRAYGDIVADLWGHTLQADRAKALFSTSATFERRATLVVLSNLRSGKSLRFRLSLVKDSSGTWIVRGFVPREFRDFKIGDLPTSGVIHIGVDKLSYTSVNASVVASGLYRDYVQDAVFTLSSQPPHDYSDSLEINDDFNSIASQLEMRVDHLGGETTVDTVLLSPTSTVVVNPSGRLIVGVSGINREVVEYQSVSVLGDRYLFTLVPGQSLSNFHGQGEYLRINAYDPLAWSQRLSGASWWYADNAVVARISDTGPGSARLISRRELAANSDFDVSVSVTLETWNAVGGADGSRRAAAEMVIGGDRYVLGVETRRLASVNSEGLVFGGSVPTFNVSVIPDVFEARFARTGNELELLYKGEGEADWRQLAKFTVSGLPATLELSASRSGLDAGCLVSFDEVIRRSGAAAGNRRLEEFFTATSQFPHVYDCDQTISSAPQLLDRPQARSEPLVSAQDVIEEGQTFIRAVPGTGFQADGLPGAGTLTVAGSSVVYDRVAKVGGLYEFQLRHKLDPGIMPLAAGAAMTASTRVLSEGSDYAFDGLGSVSFRDLPTRDRVWAPLCQIDYRHVQQTFGVLVDADDEKSTPSYLTRVQGTWFALTSGPAYGNVHSGIQLAMGLPVAMADGVVLSESESRDRLGRLVSRSMVVSGDDGVDYVHDLRADLPLLSWTSGIGSRVVKFQPLSDGVEVLDFQSDPLWHQRFVGVNEMERWNSFGVFVALEALSGGGSVEDAIRFALRIKPTYTKLFIRFLLTTSGREFLDPQDDQMFALVPELCDEVAFPYGEPPDDPAQILRLGEGHKLGQAKTLGGDGLWHFLGLDYQVIVSVETGDGSWGAGGDTFTSAGGWVFTAADIGYLIRIASGPDAGEWKITALLSPTQVTVLHVFSASAGARDWELVDRLSLAEGAELGIIRAFHCLPGPVNFGSEIVETQQVVNIVSPP